MNMEEFRIVHTCGICEEICEIEDLKDHPCMEGYNNYFIDENTLYFFPVLDDGVTIIRRNKINNQEQVVTEPLKEASTSKKRTSISNFNFDDEEMLILEVQSRPALWNYKLPLIERSNKIKKQLWEEIAQIFNGKFNAELLKSKFKSLHDTFRKIVQSEHHTSGSARKDHVKKWSHYESMKYLRDSCLYKNTVSNMDSEENKRELCNTPSIDINDDSSTIQTDSSGRKRKRGNDDDTANAINRIAEAICQPNNLILPPPPELDDVDSFLMAIGHNLRKLPTLLRLKIIQQFLQITYDALSKL